MSVEGPASPGDAASGPDLYNDLVRKTQENHRLLTVHWELTYRCNERCTHCYLDVLPPGAAPVGELTTAECKRILDELAGEGALNVSFSGGEIFARKDWHEIMASARACGMSLRLFTNGTLITPERADQVRDLHPSTVEVSLYGVDAATHDGITRLPGSFEKTLRGVRLLRERNVRVKFKTPVMRENVYQTDALEALARELGALWSYDTNITPKDSGARQNQRHQMTDEQLLWLYRHRASGETNVFRATRPQDHTCGIALNSMLIDPYGEIFPCAQTRISVGNLRDRSVHAIWSASPAWAQLGDLTLGALPVCSTCELRSFCIRCHGLALAESGDLTAPAFANCRETLIRRQVLIENGLISEQDYPVPAHLKSYRPDERLIPAQTIETRRAAQVLIPIRRRM